MQRKRHKSNPVVAFLLWGALLCAASEASAEAPARAVERGSEAGREGSRDEPVPARDEPADADGEPTGEPAEAPAELPAAEPGPSALAVSSRAAASSRGEASLDLLAQLPAGPLLLRLGPGLLTPSEGPARFAALLGASAGDGAVDLLLRLLPSQAGAALLAGRLELKRASQPWEAGLALEAAHLSLAARPPRAPALSLSSAAATLELTRALSEQVALALHAGAGLCALSTAAAARESLWLLPGTRAGQWPQRASAGAAVRVEQPGWSARLDASVLLPAAASGSALELTLSAERQWSRVALGLELAAARQQPEGAWLGRLALEVRWEGVAP